MSNRMQKMKTRIIRILLICLASGLIAADTNPAVGDYQVTIKYPSDLRAKGGRGVTTFSLDFILHPLSDLRLMYCDIETMRARISSGVCIIDFYQPIPFHKEVKVSPDSTLAQILILSGLPQLQGWRGIGQPAIRIIAKRAILAHDGTEDFLHTKIRPGDFIVVLPID